MPELHELNINAVRDSFVESLNSIGTLQELDELRVKFTGKKGELTLMLRSLGKLPPELRKQAGQELNTLRDEIEAKLEEAGRKIRDAENERKEHDERIDVTLPAKGRNARDCGHHAGIRVFGCVRARTGGGVLQLRVPQRSVMASGAGHAGHILFP